MRILFSILFFSLLVGEPAKVARPSEWATKIDSENFDNLFKVSADLYRSEQPTTAGMKELESLGIKTVISLRTSHKDDKHLKSSSLVSIAYPIHTTKINDEDLKNVLQLIEKAEKPVLIHCWHGSDRAGGVVAAYRMVKMNWKRDDAIREFREGGFGYHEGWFPNILELLENANMD